MFIFPERLNKGSISLSPPGYKNGTNNQMELKACLVALKESSKFEREWPQIIIRTDSKYVADNYLKAIYQWQKDGWMRHDGAPVLNAEMWKELAKLMKEAGCRVNIEKVKAHEDDEYNKQVDKLARDSARRASHDPLYVVNVRRKKTPIKFVAGSVVMEGQTMSIRIVTAGHLKLQNLYRYKYEVLSMESPYFNVTDTAVSDRALLAEHHYSVRFNKEKGNPRIIEVYSELDRTPTPKDVVEVALE